MNIKKNSYHTNVKIEEIVAEGKCISKIDGAVVFTPFTCPGDVVNLEIRRKKKNYLEGFVTEFIEKSDKRVEPKCEYFGTCGGCKWQHISYNEQLKAKEKQVKDALERIGHLKNFDMMSIIGSEQIYEYRNKLEYTATEQRWLTLDEIRSDKEIDKRGIGFHIPGLYDKIIDIETCYLQDDISNQIRNFIRDYCIKKDVPFFNIKNQTGQIRNVIVRTSTTGEIMLIVQFYFENNLVFSLLEEIKNNFPHITSLMYVINSKPNETFHDLEVKCFNGNDFIMEKIKDVHFKIGPKTFYQTNSKQASVLYDIVVDFAELNSKQIVYDLYTGAGTIANYIAGKVNKVVGIEYVESAIEDAKINSEINNINNTVFYAGDMKDVLNDEFITTNGKPDVIITDPPRAGMHADVLNKLLEIAAEKIVYVSCNPATQARDIEILSTKYVLKKAQPVDMFPHTHHVEVVSVLELNKS